MQKIINPKYYLFYIIGVAIIVRIVFSFGHVFSDDAYFDYLSYTLYKVDFAKDYIGYPHTPLRINLLGLTSISFALFGINEFATMVWPFIFSISNIILAYFFTKLITKNQNTALFAAILMAFFPTDIAFATINFSDSPAAFFINLGLFFLYKAHINNSLKFSLFSGLCFFISIQFKVNIFFVGLLLALLWIYLVFKNKSISYFIPVALSFVGLNLLIEGLIYLDINGDLFYRFRLIELNSLYNKNEFFVLGSSRGYASEAEFWSAVFKRVFLINPKDVYLRRFYLFLPLISVFQSIRFIKQKKYTWLAYWFFGLSLLFIGFTSSFVRYQPIILRLSWYMFPLFLPQVIISAIFISQFKAKLKTIIIVIYIFGSLLMSHHYTEYFKIKDINTFKLFVRSHPDKTVYTDHFTKYSIDLLDGYSEPLRTHRILGRTFKLKKIKAGNWIIYNIDHINELKEQGHEFPDFNTLHSAKYTKVFERGGFQVYEKNELANRINDTGSSKNIGLEIMSR